MYLVLGAHRSSWGVVRRNLNTARRTQEVLQSKAGISPTRTLTDLLGSSPSIVMSPAFAIVLGILVQPWGLVAARVAVIVEAKLTTVGSYAAILSFCVLSVITYAALEIYAGLRPARTQAFLAATKTWIETHQDQVIMFWPKRQQHPVIIRPARTG